MRVINSRRYYCSGKLYVTEMERYRMKTLKLKNNLYWAGILDPNLDVFDIIMETEFGTTYNSYLLKGSEKTVLFETAKAKFMDEYIDKVTLLTNIEDIDYIVMNHTEPDHAGSAVKLMEMNPDITLIGTQVAIDFMKEITNMEFAYIVAKDGNTLSLGDKTLKFISAPNLHWPDTMFTYIPEDKVLITCDSFGAHYSSEEILHSKITDNEGYMSALKYYFDNILGPFKPYMLKAIDKIKDLDIDIICTGHGPVLDDNPREVIEQSKIWSTETNPNIKKTVVIPYVTAYGYTKELADKITEGIKAAGDIDVRIYEATEIDNGELMKEIYWADGLLLGSPTILGEALRPILDITISMYPGIHGGKIASAFGSYGWSGEAVPHIMERLKQLRMKLYGEGLRVRFKPSDVQRKEAYDFGYGFGFSLLKGEIVEKGNEAKAVSETSAGTAHEGPVRKWRCTVCNKIVEGTEPPEKCPLCGVGSEKFELVTQE